MLDKSCFALENEAGLDGTGSSKLLKEVDRVGTKEGTQLAKGKIEIISSQIERELSY